jgi:hypothetical protein
MDLMIGNGIKGLFIIYVIGSIIITGMIVLIANTISSQMSRKKCPFCFKLILSQAVFCPYCGKDLPK